MSKLAIIGGTGLMNWPGASQQLSVPLQKTPWGEPSAGIQPFEINGQECLFLPRHGNPHRIPPHKVNYRANIWALKTLGVSSILAVYAVGGIGDDFGPGVIAIPDQLIDYAWGRAHSYSDSDDIPLQHVEFEQPFAGHLRQRLLKAAEGSEVVSYACYGVTQGPRLETAAEIRRLKQDGCHIVGMTAMPEAALARELGLDFAGLAVVANWAAGLSDGPITLEAIHQTLDGGMAKVRTLVEQLFS